MSKSSAFLNVTILKFFFKFDTIYESGRWILKDDELVSNDTVNDLFLLIFLNIIDVTSLMELCLTSVITLLAVKNLIDTDSFITA